MSRVGSGEWQNGKVSLNDSKLSNTGRDADDKSFLLSKTII